MFQIQGNLKGINVAIVRCYGAQGLLAGTRALPASMAMSTGENVTGTVVRTTESSPYMPPVSLGKPSVYVTNRLTSFFRF